MVENRSYKSSRSYSDHEQMHICKTSPFLLALILVVALSACGEKDGTHTTAITHMAPPVHQVIKIISRPAPDLAQPFALDPTADTSKPVLVFNLANGSRFRLGEEVPISLKVLNAKLRGDGGAFRIRYIVDDDDMQWRDTTEPFWLAGWLPGKHTIRVELIGPDGWPYRNGTANIVTREISVEPE
jgi:hypothetical protein